MDLVHIYQKCRCLHTVKANWRNMVKVIDHRIDGKVKLTKRKAFVIKHDSLTEHLE